MSLRPKVHLALCKPLCVHMAESDARSEYVMLKIHSSANIM